MDKPKIVLSRCFLEPVRYDGGIIVDEFVDRLKKYVEVVDICPEVGMGLGIPRDRLIIVLNGEEKKLIQPDRGKDLTESILGFSKETIERLPQVDGFLLKAKSPSCGVGSTKLYRGDRVVGRTYGFFAHEVNTSFPYLPVEDEKRLKDPDIRAHFLTRIFAYAELRSLLEKDGPEALIDFHTRYRYLLFTYNQSMLRRLERLVARTDIFLEEKIRLYRDMFYRSFLRRPASKRHLNTILHIVGQFSSRLNKREKSHLYTLIDKFEKDRIPLKPILEFIKSLAYRFGEEYVLIQKYIEPYPEELDL
jgi:uncharacterized protein YbgA (DUF1722 family)/uncharacterized protein YbbK (DUF523 family)